MSRQRQTLLSRDMVFSLLDQAAQMGFTGVVCLSYYNEPLLDHRIDLFGAYAMKLGFSRVELCTNGDYLDDDVVERLDGCVNRIKVALYDNRMPERMDAIRAMFSQTNVDFTTGLHRWTHYQESSKRQIARSVNKPCVSVAANMIIDHRGDVLACCDESVPHFDLGNVYDSSLASLWMGKQALIEALSKPGGRRNYAHCSSCPRSRRARAKQEVRQEDYAVS